MSLFTKLGETIGGSSEDESEPAESDASEEKEDVERTGPNFMPDKQKQLYLKAYENAADLSSTGVCSECGTTLRPIKAERLFAACKNEDCENYLRETEVTAVKRYEDRHGVPEEIEDDDDPIASKESGGSGSALDGLSEAMDGE